MRIEDQERRVSIQIKKVFKKFKIAILWNGFLEKMFGLNLFYVCEKVENNILSHNLITYLLAYTVVNKV